MILKNEVDVLEIKDLGIYLRQGEEIDLLDSFTADQIKRSIDLKTELDALHCIVLYEDRTLTHSQLIRELTSLTLSEHQNIRTLIHNVSENSHFEVEKQNEQTKYIRTYSSSLKDVLIKEEEIVRNGDGVVTMIVVRQYNQNGDLVETETQTLNRVEGKVESITSSVE